MNIVVLGTNRLKTTEAGGFNIHTGNADTGTVNITISGGGTLTASAEFSSFYCTGSLTVKDGTTINMTATGNSDVGIKTEKGIYVLEKSKVTSSGARFGIYVKTGLYVDRLSSLTCSGSVAAFLGPYNMNKTYADEIIFTDPAAGGSFSNTTLSSSNAYDGKTSYTTAKNAGGSTTLKSATFGNANLGSGITAPSLPVSAAVSNAQIYGVQGGGISTTTANNTVTVTLTNAVFSKTPTADEAKGFFTNIPAGMTVTPTLVSGNQQMKFKFGGTPSAVSSAGLQISIGTDFYASVAVGGGTEPLAVASNSETNWQIAAAPTATVDDVTVEGAVNVNLTSISTVVRLTGGTFTGIYDSGTTVTSWFSGLPSGITVTAKPLTDTSTVSLTFGGKPTALSSAAMSITIPTSRIKLTDTSNTGTFSAVKVTSNDDAKFAITERVTVIYEFNTSDSAVEEYLAKGGTATPPTAPVRDGYRLEGWYTDNDTFQIRFDFSSAINEDITLYAKWVQVWTVKYDSNDGSSVVDEVVDDGEKVSKPADPTRDGFEFVGWYTSDAAAEALTETELYDFDDAVAEGFTLYAGWIELFTVNFDGNNGNVAQASTIVRDGETLSDPTDPTRAGFEFDNWYTSKAYADAWNADGLYDFSSAVTENFTLYAGWREKFTVTYNGNGGAVATESAPILEGKTVTKPTAPTRTDYKFAGWFTTKALADAAASGTEYSFDTLVTESFTLYAGWLEGNTVSFETNGGTAVDSALVPFGEALSDEPTTTKTGYTFKGWYKEAGFENLYGFGTDIITIDIMLYAKWQINTYTVTFDSDGGSAVENQEIDYNEKAVKPTDPNKAGHRFDGWQLSDADYNFDTAITGDITLIAKWTRVFVITFDTNGGNDIANITGLENGQFATAPDNPTKTNYVFKGWYSDAALTTEFSFDMPIASDLTLYAKWEGEPRVVTFDANGGKDAPSQINTKYGDKIVEPADKPVKIGHTFAGWYSDESLNTAFDFDKNTITIDITLYAKWQINSYTVTFDSDGGSAVVAQTIEYNKKAVSPTDPTFVGYTFDGWYNGAAKWSFDDNVTADVTLTAKWILSAPVVNIDKDTDTEGEVILEAEIENKNDDLDYDYQWQIKEDGEWKDIDGETDSTLVLTDKDGDAGEYRCVVGVTDGTQSDSGTPASDISVVKDDFSGDGMPGWLIALIIILSLLLLLIILFIVLYILWKKKGFVLISFLTPVFRKINTLLFKTELNDVEKAAVVKAN